ncbi:hypothetical protein ATCC90586_010156 [Pythium insidiosum]|nr:hypothetical protein ATCC90586_010156 [Pythium insidiosum]
MGGNKRKTHWAVRRKNRKARAGDEGAVAVRQERVDRRAGFPEEIHPGSYAAQRKRAGDDAQQQEQQEQAPLAPKRRYGMWVAFCGKNYSGMQMNEGVKTIEAELERALFEAGGISETNYGFLQKIGWSRAGRTDKGVHAAGQMVTAKLHVGDDVEAFRHKVNELLPEDIRVMHMVTTTKNFNAKMSCDKRTYEYLAPTFIFAARQCKQRAPASGGAAAPEWPTGLLDEDGVPQDVAIDTATLDAQRAFRMSDETYGKLLATLRAFEGTHNFHNFTSKLEPTSPKCQRFIMSFGADRPFVERDGMEWIRMRVVGQSFLLHHIRKMIGTAVEVVAGVTPLETIERAFQLDKMDLPKAPSVGLYLAQAHFEVYNQRLRTDASTLPSAAAAGHPPLDFVGEEAVLERIEAFKRERIFKHIVEHEAATRPFARWLKLLDTLPFDYVSRSLEQWKKEKESLSSITNRRDRLEAEKAMRFGGSSAEETKHEAAAADKGDGDVSE